MPAVLLSAATCQVGAGKFKRRPPILSASPSPLSPPAFWSCARIDLCDFCNARGFFFGGHSAGRIFRFDVADLLQRMGVSAMSIAMGNVYRDEPMRSPIIKRSVGIAGSKTSVSLEDAFWKGLKEIASERNMRTSELVAAINSERQHGNLSSAIRLFVLGFYHDQISEHEKHDRKREMLANATVPTATPSPVT